MYVLGLAIEGFADQQKFAFKLNKDNKGKWCDAGVWKYSRVSLRMCAHVCMSICDLCICTNIMHVYIVPYSQSMYRLIDPSLP